MSKPTEDKNQQASIKYNPSEIEPKWQAKWEVEKVYQPDMASAKSSTEHEARQGQPFYNLMMFPYPSAEGLHVGNMYAFTGADVYGRYQRMKGNAAFEPIGLDGFGIHSENYALKVGSHPMDQAAKSEQNFYRQLHAIGNGYDWSRTVETYKPEYYKWTQWVFTELFKAGLAYRAEAQVNWCPSCKTVLADEQVLQKETQGSKGTQETNITIGVCERCGTEVEKRKLEQWFFRITDYAERLLTDLEKIDWTEKVKIAQRNWIGKSTGAEIEFRIKNHESRIKVFTTRPDTLHGATFMVISPEHNLVTEILKSPKGTSFSEAAQAQDDNVKKEVEDYVKTAQSKSERERTEEGKEKTGVFSGIYAINPANDQQIPVWIADYVLMGYGTGAIMAVPAHDLRDFEFAKKYNLPIKHVVMPSRIDKVNPPQEGKEETKREVVLVILKDPKQDKYLTLKWKEQPWQTFITGGMEEGEDPVEAARREITEETGYTGVKFIRELGGPTEAFFYAAHKGVNRQTRAHLMYFELEDEEKENVADTERERYEIQWLTKEEADKAQLRHSELDLIWERIETGNDSYAGTGVLINSDEWNGWETLRSRSEQAEDHTPADAKEKATAWLEEKGIGKKKVQYHLRDWLISRQRYWGAPIPMVYCEACAKKGDSWFTWEKGGKKEQEMGISNDKYQMSNIQSEENSIGNLKLDIGHSRSEAAGWYPVPENQLPVELPRIEDYRPVGTGKAPLANHPEFYETTCPGCGGPAKRETDVSDTFLDSGWYFLRYPATDLEHIPFPMSKEAATYVILSGSEGSHGRDSSPSVQNDKEIEDAAKRVHWLPVDQYTGGAEHSVLHLLYSRFITKVFHDLGMVDFDEPFPKFYAHGLLIKEGAKMSKSKGNVVVPDEYIRKYGADTLRTYLMFLGPFSDGGDFQDTGIEGVHRFMKRVWHLFTTKEIAGTLEDPAAKAAMHSAIKGVTEDISKFRYNTAIAKIMTWYNQLSDRETLTSEEVEVFLKLLAPFAPHMTEEIYQRIRNQESGIKDGEFRSIHLSEWPLYDESLLVSDTVTIAIQVNGKLRDTVTVETAISNNQSDIEELAKQSEKVKKFIEGKEIRKAIYVPGKILNLVV